jgi:hypothetical protein
MGGKSMLPHQQGPYMYNMYPFEPYQAPQVNYYQPFQISQMNSPMFYPPQPQAAWNPYTPYPTMNKQNYKKQQQGQFSSVVSQFKTADGNYDINKMMNTAGQMMNAMNQVTGLVKQVGGFFIK